MQIKKSVAVAMLVALGFSKADEWDDEKLSERMLLIPQKVGREDVPDEFDKVYDSLAEADKIELLDDAGAVVEKPAKAAKPDKKAAKPAAKAKKDDRPYIKPVKDAAKKAPKAADADEEEVKGPKKAAKPAKAEKADKPAKAAKGPRPLRDGSIAAAVEGVMTKEWQDEAAIAEEAKLEVRIARGRLYHAASKGLYERRHSIQYRLAPAKKAV